MPDPNIDSALYVSPNRNYTIPFNYIWDNADQHWTPMQKGDCGGYMDSITAQAKDFIHKFGRYLVLCLFLNYDRFIPIFLLG